MTTHHTFPHRTAQATLTVCKPDGAPLAHQEVTVAQRKQISLWQHRLGALALANGVLEGEFKAHAERVSDAFFDLFNFATLPFYWDASNRSAASRARSSCARERNTSWARLRAQGAPLCWHTVTAPWLLDLSNAEILEAQIGASTATWPTLPDWLICGT
jgi:hypothetical protein